MAASSSSSLAFSVRRGEPQLVVPAKPTPRGLKQLSDIDVQEFLRFQVPVIIFFQSNPLMEGKDPARVIREALAKTLVFYYPFAGRLIEGPTRKLMVDCTGEGVLFTDADADVTLEQLGDTIQPPCACLEELLYDVPRSGGILGCPLLLVQVTRLLCGGCIIAFRFHHTMCDGPGFVQFLQTIGEMAQGAVAPSVPPVWQRELLDARDPPRITCTHNEYEDEADDTQIGKDHSNMVHRSFFFGPKQIKSIRNHLPPHRRACTTFELLTACLWKCRVLSFALDPNETVRVSCTVNVRRNKQILNLPRGYYGNAFAMPAAVSKADLVCKNNLEYALQLVQKAKASVNEEYMRSLADFIVMKGGRAPSTISQNFIVSENRHGFGDVDFGLGKPLYAGLAGAVSITSFYMRFKNSKGEDGIVVPIWLPSPVMEKFEQVLAKMTREPVEKSYDIKPTRIMSML